VLLAVAVLVGCGGGGDGDGTTEPPPPPGNQTLGSITTSVSNVTLDAGNSATLTVTAWDLENAVIANAGTPTFTSQSPTIAEIDASGIILAVSQGTTTINVSLTRGGVTKTATVTVTVDGNLPVAASVTAGSGDYNFTPAYAAIARGGSVTWSFGILEHTVTFTPAAGVPASINTGGYASAISRTFNMAGNFNYHCTIHAGMNGRVVVR
jgi:plastocyanin